MSDQDIPEIQFDEKKAMAIFPRPELKQAALVPMPHLDTEGTLPTFIRPEWGGVQIFFGDYYAVIKNGIVIYGSAKEQWEAMHSVISPGYWVKTAIPTAYVATIPCRIVTLIPDEHGIVKEANFVLSPGDWIVRQPGGEVQHIKKEKFAKLYFTPDEALNLGLMAMSNAEFGDWAIAQSQLQGALR